jgi:alkanesulfonate monooxygenase SsuD/methylene tetrahydromethanopterin reductase-like flavin-dependent oxidoreductase (luciferase family)
MTGSTARSIQFGVQLPQGWRGDLPPGHPTKQWEHVVHQTQRIEGLGFQSAWLVDHLEPVLDPTGPLFECWSAMAALAMATSTIRLGQLATCSPFRPAPLFAKMVACIDVISGGRVDVGIGAGWYEREFNTWGYDFAPAGERITRLEHAIEDMVARWTGAVGTMAPRPVQTPYPPLWVAGGGERRTFAVVARHASWANVAGTPDVVAHKAAALRAHCERIGRSPDEVGLSVKLDAVIGHTDADVAAQLDEATASWRARGYDSYADTGNYRAAHIVGTPSEVRDRVEAYVAAGATYFVLDVVGADGPALELLAETLALEPPVEQSRRQGLGTLPTAAAR